MAGAYAGFRTPDGRLPVTIEVLCGQAWSPDPAARRRGGSEASVPLAALGRRPPPR
jgi:hypothetical protein